MTASEFADLYHRLTAGQIGDEDVTAVIGHKDKVEFVMAHLLESRFYDLDEEIPDAHIGYREVE